MAQEHLYNKSILVQVMAWSYEAPSHWLSNVDQKSIAGEVLIKIKTFSIKKMHFKSMLPRGIHFVHDLVC